MHPESRGAARVRAEGWMTGAPRQRAVRGPIAPGRGRRGRWTAFSLGAVKRVVGRPHHLAATVFRQTPWHVRHVHPAATQVFRKKCLTTTPLTSAVGERVRVFILYKLRTCFIELPWVAWVARLSRVAQIVARAQTHQGAIRTRSTLTVAPLA